MDGCSAFDDPMVAEGVLMYIQPPIIGTSNASGELAHSEFSQLRIEYHKPR